jgi:hypothetical protein
MRIRTVVKQKLRSPVTAVSEGLCEWQSVLTTTEGFRSIEVFAVAIRI